MKTKDLIKELQELDPTGECQVFGDGDIYFCEKVPWYYDGRPGILIRDESKKPYYDVVGIRQINETDGDKIYLKCMTLENVLYDSPQDRSIITEGNPEFLKEAEEIRQKWIKWHEDNNIPLG